MNARPSPPPSDLAVPISDRVHQYLGFGVRESKCRVRVYRRPDKQIVVLLTELQENPGTSVSNAIEQLASELAPTLVKEIGELGNISWIGHVPPRLFSMARFEHFDEVGPYYARTAWGKGFSSPRWMRMRVEEVESLVGGRLEV